MEGKDDPLNSSSNPHHHRISSSMQNSNKQSTNTSSQRKKPSTKSTPNDSASFQYIPSSHDNTQQYANIQQQQHNTFYPHHPAAYYMYPDDIHAQQQAAVAASYMYAAAAAAAAATSGQNQSQMYPQHMIHPGMYDPAYAAAFAAATAAASAYYQSPPDSTAIYSPNEIPPFVYTPAYNAQNQDLNSIALEQSAFSADAAMSPANGPRFEDRARRDKSNAPPVSASVSGGSIQGSSAFGQSRSIRKTPAASVHELKSHSGLKLNSKVDSINSENSDASRAGFQKKQLNPKGDSEAKLQKSFRNAADSVESGQENNNFNSESMSSSIKQELETKGKDGLLKVVKEWISLVNSGVALALESGIHSSEPFKLLSLPFDLAMRQSDALEIAIYAAMFDFRDALSSSTEIYDYLITLCDRYLYGSKSLHRLILDLSCQLSDNPEQSAKEKAAAHAIISMLKHAFRESTAFYHETLEMHYESLSNSILSEEDKSANQASEDAVLNPTENAASIVPNPIQDAYLFRLLCAVVQSRTLRLAVFRGFREQLVGFVSFGQWKGISIIESLAKSIEDELYDSIASAQQKVCEAWEQLVKVCHRLLVTQYESVQARVTSLETDIIATEELGDLREVLRRVTQLSRAHEAVLRYCTETSLETNRVLRAFYTLFNLAATIYSGLDTQGVAFVSNAAQKMSRLSNEVSKNTAILDLIALVKDAAVNNPSELMGMGNKTTRALRFEASSQKTAEMRAKRHARMMSSPDELINRQDLLAESMMSSDDEASLHEADSEDYLMKSGARVSETANAVDTESQEPVTPTKEEQQAIRTKVNHEKMLVPLSSPPRKPSKVNGTPGKSPQDKHSLSAQHYRSRSVEEIIFIG